MHPTPHAPQHTRAQLRTSARTAPAQPACALYTTGLHFLCMSVSPQGDCHLCQSGERVWFVLFTERPGANAVPDLQGLLTEGYTSLQVTARLWLQVWGSLFPWAAQAQRHLCKKGAPATPGVPAGNLLGLGNQSGPGSGAGRQEDPPLGWGLQNQRALPWTGLLLCG